MSIPLLSDAVTAIYPLIAHLVAVLEPWGGATATIVVCTVVLRLLLLPLTLFAVRGERVRLALAPQLNELQRVYGQDPARWQKEVATLYQSTGTSPMAGCLPMLAQSPFFMIWYQVFTTSRISDQPNALLSQQFLGSDLSAHLIDGRPALAFLSLIIALIVLGTLTLWRTRRVAVATEHKPPHGILAALPFASVLSALVMPLAAIVYLVTTMTWTAVENMVLRRGMPARAATKAETKAETESKTKTKIIYSKG